MEQEEMKPKNKVSEKNFKNGPIVESQVGKSKDGKYIIHRTTITDIKPKLYYERVMENKEE